MKTRLDITIGPVQGFVAQSRRTRDLWGSSYLLSFLSAHAMRGAANAGGTIVRPVVDDDPLHRWVCDDREGAAPRIGSVPNHFVVEVEADHPARPVADEAGRALRKAWMQVCQAVRARFVTHAVADGHGTETVWTRQVEAFWEVTWAAGDAAAGGGLLARRKHWRTHRLPAEPGDKCTVMPDLQELSGHVRAENRGSREKQDAFWARVRERTGDLDLPEKERLCAIALVKRLFPKVAPAALGWPVDTRHWPSTVYVGAVPWIRRVVSTAPRQARRYAAAVQQSASDVLAESGTLFADLQATEAGDFPRLDANYFHREHVQSERQCLLRDDAPSGARRELVKLLKSIYDAGDEARRPGPPPTFYALLLADGDRLGRLVGELGGAPVGKALSTFTNQVPEIVRKHDGVTIYAGGDDVLAMLPVPPALACAASLASAYTSAFPQDARTNATLSAAVAFAQIRLPLAGAIDEAHRLLDEVAKAGNGRDSLAAGVLKPGGLHCQWTTTWMRRSAAGESEPAVVSLRRLVESLRAHAGEPGLSSALVYRIRHLLARLCDWHRGEPDHGAVVAGNSAAGPGGLHRWRPGGWGAAPAGLDLRQFLRAEIGHSLAVDLDEGTDERADDLTDRVGELLKPARTPGASDGPPGAEVGVDALLLARFLASSGHEETVR